MLAITLLVVSTVISFGLIFFGLRYLANRAQETNQQVYEQTQTPASIDFAAAADAPVLGSPNAPVTVIEFADFQCPFCKAFHDLIFDRLKRDFIETGKAKFVFQDFAFLGQESTDAAAAARCAHDQGKFWEYFDALYAAQTGENIGNFSEANLLALGSSVGVVQSEFTACVTSKLGAPQVQAETERAGQAGISATPTLLINGKVLEGIAPEFADKYYADLSNTINEAWENSK